MSLPAGSIFGTKDSLSPISFSAAGVVTCISPSPLNHLSRLSFLPSLHGPELLFSQPPNSEHVHFPPSLVGNAHLILMDRIIWAMTSLEVSTLTISFRRLSRSDTFIIGSTNDPKSPRGVRGFQLNDGNFTDWKVQGKIGGYTEYVTISSSVVLSFHVHHILPVSRTKSGEYSTKVDYSVKERDGIYQASTHLPGRVETLQMDFRVTQRASDSL